MKRRLGDRRGRPRFEIVGELRGTLDTVIGLPLVDIGKSGALVESPVALTPAVRASHHGELRRAGNPSPRPGAARAECSFTGRPSILPDRARISLHAVRVGGADQGMDDRRSADRF